MKRSFRRTQKGGAKGSVKRGHPNLTSGYTTTISIKDRLYKGDLKDGKPHGHGIMKYADGDVYEGEWKYGDQHGHGIMKWNNGDVYEGEWEYGSRGGHGIMKYADGNVYEGEWKDGRLHGHGIMKYKKGNVYEGELKDGERHGHGIMKFENGDVYEGEWKDGLRNGHGIMKRADGDVYEGEWKDGDQHGHGIMKWNNGNVYEGEWKDDHQNGHGIMKYADGNVYEGEWKYGRLHGHGIMKYKKGNVYEGEWYRGEVDGRGIMKYKKGDVYEGELKDGERHGHGIMKYKNGNVYEGNWDNSEFKSGIISTPIRLPNGELSGLTIRSYSFENGVRNQYVPKMTGRSISRGRKRGSPSLSKTQRSLHYPDPAADLLSGFPGDESEIVKNLLQDKDNIIVINQDIENTSANKLVFTVDAIKYFLKKENQADNIFYECLPRDPKTYYDIDKSKPYVGLYVSPNGNKGLISERDVKKMAAGVDREFVLKKIGNFPKTRSWGASYLAGYQIDYVSKKHCQEGSDFDVYSLQPIMLSKVRGSPTLRNDVSPGSYRSRPIPLNNSKLEKLPSLPARFRSRDS